MTSDDSRSCRRSAIPRQFDVWLAPIDRWIHPSIVIGCRRYHGLPGACWFEPKIHHGVSNGACIEDSEEERIERSKNMLEVYRTVENHIAFPKVHAAAYVMMVCAAWYRSSSHDIIIQSKDLISTMVRAWCHQTQTEEISENGRTMRHRGLTYNPLRLSMKSGTWFQVITWSLSVRRQSSSMGILSFRHL